MLERRVEGNDALAMTEHTDNVYRIGLKGRLPRASRRVRELPCAVLAPRRGRFVPALIEGALEQLLSFDESTFSVPSAPTADGGEHSDEGAFAKSQGSNAPDEGSVAGDGRQSAGRFGWVSGILPSPAKGDCYIVEFLDGDSFCILAYADRFGRAFTVDHPISAPPAREPDLAFLPSGGGDESADAGNDAATGSVVVRMPQGAMLQPAGYHRANGLYGFSGSWHDFGEYGSGLSLADAIARAYLAFVYRPARYKTPVFEHGLVTIMKILQSDDIENALGLVIACVGSADADPALCAPPLARCLSRWLEDAGAAMVSAAGTGASGLALARAAQYADLLYLSASENSAIPKQTVWALEAALNRCVLVAAERGDSLSEADIAECCKADDRVRESIGLFVADAAHPKHSDAAGEWSIRCTIASDVERLRLPYRVEADFRMDASEGIVSFAAVVPSAQVMPKRTWSKDASAWVDVPDADRVGMSMRYALRVAVVLASIAFGASSSVSTVSVTLTSLPEDASPFSSFAAEEGISPSTDSDAGTAFAVSFDRARFCANEEYRAAALGNPTDYLRSFGAALADASEVDPFAAVKTLPSYEKRLSTPEIAFGSLPISMRSALGARSMEGLRIFDRAERRRVAERLAGRLSHARSASESVAMVRSVQSTTGDPLVHEACTRLMTALAEGTVDTEDQNEVVNAFLGEDRYLTTLRRAKSIARSSGVSAIELLKESVMNAESEGRFSDSSEVVHRVFDTYASRVVYNLAREQALPWIDQDHALADAKSDASVELVPDSLYACCLDLASLVERVPDHAEEAIAYGRRCIQLAPTIAAGYRQTARACMVANRPLEARGVLLDCLRIAVRHEDAAVAYYQIAFAEWNLGNMASAVAAYLKSLDLSSVVAPQAAVELRRLVSEHDLQLLDRSEIDPVLVRAGIPVIPEDDLVRVLDRAIGAAVDVGAFPVAHNLLSLRLSHRPDDALASVARSLT